MRRTPRHLPGAPAHLPDALRAALWQRDQDGVRVAADRLDADPDTSACIQANRLAARAGIAALEGRRDDTVTAYGEALRRFRALGLDFELARTALDLVLLVGPDTPEAVAAANEARAIFERLGARPYLDRLAAAMGDAQAAGTSTARPA